MQIPKEPVEEEESYSVLGVHKVVYGNSTQSEYSQFV